MSTTPDNVMDVILTSDRLPSPSGVALQILELTRSDDASVEDLQRVLVADPSLSGQILKFANSAGARGNHEARTVGEAVVRLGMSTVQQLALGFSLLSGARSGPCEGFDYNRFWSASLARAVAAQNLAGLVSRTPGDEAFTCGLLGNIGCLCLASVHSRDYTSILAHWRQGTLAALRTLEAEVLLIDHDQVTDAIMRSWGLPERYGEAILAQRHLEEGKDEGTGLARVLHIAQGIADICLADDAARGALTAGVLDRAEHLGLAQADVTEASDRALEQWSTLGELLDIITEDVPSLAELAERADQHKIESVLDPSHNEDGDGLLDTADLPLRVLVVDDSALDRKLVCTYLEREGHRVEVAVDGRQGLATTLRWNPHIILSDWMMPEMDGLELCRALRKSTQVGNVYVMMMTSNDQAQDLVTALDAGADDYIPKPVNQAVLIARLRAATRVIRLQERTARDREAIRNYAADLAVANRKLKHMALNDALTGLPNRRYAMDRLAKEWDRARRQDKPFICMLMDIDHFKNVNDTHGHDAGDVVLQRTAAAMKTCLRSSDDVCRFGGEEFLCICPDADLEVAQVMGDRMRRAVEQNQIDTSEFNGHVTVSIGVAAYSPDLESMQELLKMADEGLYAAKEAGRNKVCIVGGVAVG